MEVEKVHSKRKLGDYGKIVFDSFPMAILVCDPALKIMSANKAFLDAFQATIHEVEGKDLFEALELGAKEYEEVNRAAKNLLQSGSHSEEIEIRHNYPRVGYKITNMRIVKADAADQEDATELFIFINDQTEKVLLMEKIRQIKEELRTVFDGITDGISIINRDFEILRVNTGLLNIFGGESFDDFLGKKCYGRIRNRANVCIDCPALKTYETGNVANKVLSIKDGPRPKLILDIFSFPLVDESGEIYGFVEYFKDITNKVDLETQLLESERIRAISPLASGVAHELRNPLAIIRSSAQLCELINDEGTKDQELNENMEIIIKNVDSASDVVKRLLDFSKPKPIQFRIGDVNDTIHECSSLIKTRCDKDSIRLVKDCMEELPPVRLDPEHFLQGVINFLANSVDAMKDDGGTLTISTKHDTENRAVVVQIQDTGAGMSKDALGQAFDPFFTTKTDGIGLGLAISKNIIRSHGGSVTMESQVGDGTTVIIHLPVIQEG